MAQVTGSRSQTMALSPATMPRSRAASTSGTSGTGGPAAPAAAAPSSCTVIGPGTPSLGRGTVARRTAGARAGEGSAIGGATPQPGSDGQVQRGEHDAVAGQPRAQLAAVPQHPDQPHRPEQVLHGERGPERAEGVGGRAGR